MRQIHTLALILLIAAISCKTQKPVANMKYEGGSEDLYRYQWVLAELNNQAWPDSKAMLAMSPGQIGKLTGHTGCNRFNGTVELTGDHMLKLDPGAMTRMACPGENVEAPFVQALRNATHWGISKNVLTLYQGATPLARFRAVDVSGAFPSELAGSWELEFITGPRIAFEGLYPEKRPTLILDGSADYKGNTSCNSMTGKFTVKGNAIKFNPPAATMMACPGIGEQTFLKTLDMIEGWALDGDKLVLKGKDADMMRLVRK